MALTHHEQLDHIVDDIVTFEDEEAETSTDSTTETATEESDNAEKAKEESPQDKETKETESTEESASSTDDVSIDDLISQAEAMEDGDTKATLLALSKGMKKQVEDTKKWGNTQRMKTTDLEKKIQDLESKASEAPPKDQESLEGSQTDFMSDFDTKFEEDPLEAVKTALKALQGTQSSPSITKEDIEVALNEREMQSQETAMAEKHEDYYELISNTFLPEHNSNERIKTEFEEKGSTAEVAYEIALRLKKEQLIREDPEAFEKQLIDKLKQEMAKETDNTDGTAPKAPKTLASANSKSTGTKESGPERDQTPEEAFDEVLADIHSR